MMYKYMKVNPWKAAAISLVDQILYLSLNVIFIVVQFKWLISLGLNWVITLALVLFTQLFDILLNPSQNSSVSFKTLRAPCYSLIQYIYLKLTLPIVYLLCKSRT